MKPEQKFWDLLRDHLPGVTERVENLVNDGTPDVDGGYAGTDYWLELKVCRNKRKERDPYDLCRPSQRVWHARRAREGSLIFVAVRYPAAIRLYVCEKHRAYAPVLVEPLTGGKFNWEHFTRKFIYILYRERKERDDRYRLRNPGTTG